LLYIYIYIYIYIYVACEGEKNVNMRTVYTVKIPGMTQVTTDKRWYQHFLCGPCRGCTMSSLSELSQ
jgi:hypothetical protein